RTWVFLFQAEDGIRDFHVTGVQTCALPISLRERLERLGVRVRTGASARSVVARPGGGWSVEISGSPPEHTADAESGDPSSDDEQAGRASCRGRRERKAGSGRGARRNVPRPD